MGRDESAPIPKEVVEAISGGGDIDLIGDINEAMVDHFLGRLDKAKGKDGNIVLTITSAGGDPDLTRRIMLEIERAREAIPGRFLFLGKSTVYSAATSIMAAFPCRDRYLTRDAILLIHGRELDLTINLSGPLRLSRPRVEALLGEIDTGIRLEEENFIKLIGDSGITLDELIGKAMRNWYLTAAEAHRLKLVGGVV